MRSLTKSLIRSSRLVAITVPFLKINPFVVMKPMLMPFNYRFSEGKVHTKNILKSTYEGDGFHIQQMLIGCFAIYSYYVESDGQAILIDPHNDISKFVQLLKQRNAKLKGVFLTHYHADLVGGHSQLQKAFGCQVYLGTKAMGHKGISVLKDGQKVKLGSVQLQSIHTPGNTEESSCLFLHDKSGKQDILFTGNTVLLDEFGKPDLTIKTNLSPNYLAELLYDSVQKVKKINDDVRIYPGHGSSSTCENSIGAGDYSQMGTQRKNNPALRQTSKASFVQQVLKQMPTPPVYYAYNASLHKFDQFDYQWALKRAYTKLSLQQLNKLKQSGIKVIDVRGLNQLNSGIITGAICIEFNGGFANWVGTLIRPQEQIMLYGQEGTVVQAIKKLLNIGYTNIRGYSNFKMEQWRSKELPSYIPEWADSVFETGTTALDVRKPGQWETGVVDTDVVTFELSDLFLNVQKLDKSKKYIIYCVIGYRARIAYSFLKGYGYDVKAFLHSLEKVGRYKRI